MEVFKAVSNYEIEQTVLTQGGKMCAELGEYVRKRDCEEEVAKLQKEKIDREAFISRLLVEKMELEKRASSDTIYGKLYDLVNIAEHLRGIERVNKVKEVFKAISQSIKGTKKWVRI